MLVVKIHTKISKFYQHFRGTKTHGQNFWNLNFFIWKDKVKRIWPEEKSTWAHIIFIHKSFNEIVDKIVFISLKTEQQKWNFTFFGKLYLTFSLIYFSIFCFFESHQNRVNKKQKAILKSHFQNFKRVAQNGNTRRKLTKYEQPWATVVV